nr:Rep [Trichosanthes kirilowii CRESS virus]
MVLAVGMRFFVDSAVEQGFDPSFVIDKWIKYNQGVFDRYAVGLDSQYMVGKDGLKRPHYHVHFITKTHWADGREVTPQNYSSFRDKFGDAKKDGTGRMKLGRGLEVKTRLWDGNDKFLAYAVKEKFIRANFEITKEFKELMIDCLATKKAEQKKDDDEKAKKEHNVKQKNDVIEYITQNYESAFNAITSYYTDRPSNRYSYPRDNPAPDSFGEIYVEARAIRLCIEQYQNLKDKTFRRFDVENYVLTYFRKGLGKTPIQMLDVRDALHL